MKMFQLFRLFLLAKIASILCLLGSNWPPPPPLPGWFPAMFRLSTVTPPMIRGCASGPLVPPPPLTERTELWNSNQKMFFQRFNPVSFLGSLSRVLCCVLSGCVLEDKHVWLMPVKELIYKISKPFYFSHQFYVKGENKPVFCLNSWTFWNLALIITKNI